MARGHGFTEAEWTDADRWRDSDAQLERRAQHGSEVGKCPKCGGIAIIRPYYLGGWKRHHIYWCCESEGQHQGPVLREHGRWIEAEYYRERTDWRGDTFKIVTHKQAELLRAQRRYIGMADLAAYYEGGQPWQYEPPMPDLELCPFYIEACQAEQAARAEPVAVQVIATVPAVEVPA